MDNKTIIKNKLVNFLTHQKNIIKSSFIQEISYPYIAIILGCFTIILASIQYSNNRDYFQKIFSPDNDNDKTYAGNAMLYYLDFIGINGMIVNTPGYVFYYVATYLLLALIECNIGHIAVLFFLAVLFMYRGSIKGFEHWTCFNDAYNASYIGNESFCCGSYILWASLGFCLYVYQKHITLRWRIAWWILMLCVFIGLVINDYYIYNLNRDEDRRVCGSFFHHALNYVLGIFCAIVLSQ
jgi:hypothetical protein